MIKDPQDTKSFVFQVFNNTDAQEVEILFQARKIPYGLKTDRGVWYFFIPNHSSTRAKNELLLLRKEIIQKPAPFKPPSGRSLFTLPHTAVIGALVLFHAIVSRSPQRHDWVNAGASSANDIMKGELGRVVTALTLHGDDVHITGNILFLWFLGNAVGNCLGYGVGWLLILFSGAGGNLLNAIFHQTAHNSIGASTALFGAIGIITGLRISINVKLNVRMTFKEKYLPIVTLAALFAFLGLNPESDIMAHFFGGVFGFFLGYLSTPIAKTHLIENSNVQGTALVMFFFTIFMAWQ